MQDRRKLFFCRTSPNHRLPPAMTVALAMSISLAPSLSFATPSMQEEGATGQVMGVQPSDAMRRDLKLNEREMANYIAIERTSITALPAIEKAVGDAYAGSWIDRGADGQFKLMVATTSQAAATRARALGAETRLYPYTLRQLDASKSVLDRLGKQRRSNSSLYAWYVDRKTNELVVVTGLGQTNRAIDLIAETDIDASQVRIVESAQRPSLAYSIGTELFGGYRYLLSNGNSCSAGFIAFRNNNRGFITAGHCGATGVATYKTTLLSGGWVLGMGSMEVSSFPGNDFAWTSVVNGWVYTAPLVALQSHAPQAGAVAVQGSAQAPVGAAVCRSGATTGYRCGSIVASNVTVDYGASGIVFGLTQTNACVGFGDSGGSVITPAGQAQGVVSGGAFPINANDNCSLPNPATFYQPLQPLMAQNGIVLQLSN
jgi:S1-C subfamily serine protease